MEIARNPFQDLASWDTGTCLYSCNHGPAVTLEASNVQSGRPRRHKMILNVHEGFRNPTTFMMEVLVVSLLPTMLMLMALYLRSLKWEVASKRKEQRRYAESISMHLAKRIDHLERGEFVDRRRDRTCNLLIRSQAPCHWASRPISCSSSL